MSKTSSKFINLPSSNSAIQLLIRNQRIMRYQVNKNQNEYRYLIFKYQNILKELRIFINDLVGTNKFSEAAAISAIIFDGYVSYNKNFQIYCGNSKTLDMCGYNGIDIIDGIGCCRHFSSFSTDTFSKDFVSIPCHINGTNRLLSPEVLADIKLCNLTPDDLADHLCILFSYYNRYYIFDPLNVNIYYVDNQSAICINDYEIMQLYYENLIADSFYSNRKMNQLFKKISLSNGNIFDELAVNKINEAQEIVLNNSNQCDNFYNNIKNNIKEVHEQKKLIIKRFR